MQHLAQIEQLVTLLWAMKEDKEFQAQQQIEAVLKEAEAKQEYYSMAEF